jgi:hypothetical protein
VVLIRTKLTSCCQVSLHLSRVPFQVTYRNEEHHENVEGAGNMDSSATGDSAHLSLNQNVCREEEYNCYFILLDYVLRTLSHQGVREYAFHCFIIIAYFPFHMNLTHIFMQYY